MKPFNKRLALLLIGLLITSLSGCVFYSEALSPMGDSLLEAEGNVNVESPAQSQAGEISPDRDAEAKAKGSVNGAVSKQAEAEQGEFSDDQQNQINNQETSKQQEIQDSSPSSQQSDWQKEGSASREEQRSSSDSNTGQGTRSEDHLNAGEELASGEDAESKSEGKLEKDISEINAPEKVDPNSRTEQEEANELTVTFTIIGPADIGTILEDTVIDFKEGETVLDTLKRVTRAHKIQMEYRGRKSTAYIEGIHNIYEFDYGAESGWLYSVNGVFPNRGAGVWSVEPNDHIRWLYTVDLGKDWDAFLPELGDKD